MEERMDCFSLVPLSTAMRGRSDRRAAPAGVAPPDRPGGDRAVGRAAALGGAPIGTTGRNAMGLGKREGEGMRRARGGTLRAWVVVGVGSGAERGGVGRQQTDAQLWAAAAAAVTQP